MEIKLLGGELIVNICFENSDKEFDDNICLSFFEPCLDDTRIFRASETNLYITPQEARELAGILLKAAEASDLSSHDSV
ncbi:MAG: hypothetical protein CVU41_08045 [Chloroflexi bacterium HGW-Chloroflexi-3]|jgi:hypothetical protein|nr:MAG: hypothetical protein CVU41_08045 [Chloroflexi bacterium HGW-Chloroflexi-3]PKO10271.1 MAG: hypothetical protein CVU40_06660 [Chloroflexi bacterium HGW-Chloroflexi-2]